MVLNPLNYIILPQHLSNSRKTFINTTKKYINSITFTQFMKTEIIPTKFSKQDVIAMDLLIEKGEFISRSDFLRQAARDLMKKKQNAKTYGDVLVKVL